MKKILILAHEFPPLSGGFVMRALKFSKYLPEFGWHPVVVTAEPEDCYFSHGWARDPSLLAEIEGRATVYRIPSGLERQARRWRDRLTHRQSGTAAPSTHTNAGTPRNSSPTHGKVTGFLRGLYVFQDQSGLWVPHAIPAALKIIRAEKIDALLTTSPPHWVQIAGYWLKGRTRLPWVADFRDGWSDDAYFMAESALRRRLENQLERSVLHQVDAALVTTNHFLRSFQRRYPALSEKFFLIRNGLDSDDFPDWVPVREDPVVSFVHFGNLGGLRDPRPLLQAFEILVKRGALQPGQFRLQFVGKAYDDLNGAFPNVRVEAVPTVRHAEAVQRMTQAGVLVLVAGAIEGEAAFTSKIFEYLAARRPILAVIPERGELADMLRSYGLAAVATPEDPEKISAGILHTFRLASNPVELAPQDEILVRQFDRRTQAGELAGLLDRLLEQRS